jgi:hypothetical protein
MARNKKNETPEETQPANITPLPKKKSRKRAFTEAMAQTVNGDGPLVPVDAPERYAWERMWDMIYAKMLPLVVNRIEAKIQEERQAA